MSVDCGLQLTCRVDLDHRAEFTVVSKPTPLYTQASHRSHEVVSMPGGRPFKCPYEGCGSTNTVGKGVRKTKTMGVRKIRLCKGCGRKFTPKNQKPVEPDPERWT